MSPRQPKVGDKALFTGETSSDASGASDVRRLWDSRRVTPHLVIAVKEYGCYLIPVTPEVSPFSEYYVARVDSLRVIEAATYERLPDPEPEYIAGAVYQDAGGAAFLRHGARWRAFSGEVYNHDHPIRPLTRLVPEGGAS